ncbi:hypothetical protein T484DRAFT_1745209 [Baffinella frigidus]|nr:hypothetical protein T484DRAFT_1745209 [Cryptophyta sp. CCMP2293]
MLLLGKFMDACLAPCRAANLWRIIGAPGTSERPSELRNATLHPIAGAVSEADETLYLMSSASILGVEDDTWEIEATALLGLESDEPSRFLVFSPNTPQVP